MKTSPPFIPDSSQTVGPFFRIGLEHLMAREAKLDAGATGVVRIGGRVLDANGEPVPDAMLEFWSPLQPEQQDGYPGGFHRAGTDDAGRFSLLMKKPEAVPFPGGGMQAPHAMVLVFCRGLLRNLMTRVYFGGEESNAADPVLLSIPAGRRRTLIAQHDAEPSASFCWNVVLQGADETVFFEW